jgi:TnpA family transposase
MNAEQQGKRKLTLAANAPVDFIPKRLVPIVMDGGGPSRPAWECALMLKLQEEIRSGNLSVSNSKRFGRFDDYFLPQEQWAQRREGFFQRSGLPSDPREVADYLKARLNRAYDIFLQAAPANSYASMDEGEWSLSTDVTEKLSTEETEKLDRLKNWLGRHMRTTRLTDMLIEVDNNIRFTDHFLPPAQKGKRDRGEICTVLAAVLAHGCNIGLGTMADLIEGSSYKQLKRVSDWQMTEDGQRAALAAIVHAISRLDATIYWGEGRTSASDGQRFSLPRRILQQTYSTCFSDFALEFYTFIADNYAPFHSMPIECTDRDAAFVLDGLLYNESDLPLDEHFVDTHGFTELNCAAFAMLGRRFSPRIKGVRHQRIYRIDTTMDYGQLAPMVSKAGRTIDPQAIVDHWDRMGQFYASLESGHTTASVALKRLVSCSAKNHFYRANRDLGRIIKTEFLLSYMSEPGLRARIRRGLLKVEQLHALARDIYYGRRGRINARELHEQMNSCSCLTLLAACVIYWQAKEISRVVRMGVPEGEEIDFSLLEHVSPIEWENVILYGRYVLNPDNIR